MQQVDSIIDAIAFLATDRDNVVHYQDMMLRWLQAKRDYPWLNDPEPKPANFWIAFLHRDRIIREFERAV
jgi:hypothetical protein